jgi:branched-chain amino acid transport system ATP-binding protein
MLQRDRRAQDVSPSLLLGSHAGRAPGERDRTLSHVYALFPFFGERRTQLAGSLSGEEQQMCAIGRETWV